MNQRASLTEVCTRINTHLKRLEAARRRRMRWVTPESFTKEDK